MALNLPSLQGLASRAAGPHAEPMQAQARAQDKFNLDVSNAISTLVGPVTWVPLQLASSWAYYDNVSTSPAYFQDPTGRVWLRGKVKSGLSSKPLFSTPTPVPSRDWTLQVITSAGVGYVVVWSSTQGSKVTLESGGNGWLSLDSISYVP